MRARTPVSTLGALVLLAAGSLLLASGASQTSASGNVLEGDGPLVFDGVLDTVVENVNERPAPLRESAATVRLRGPDTGVSVEAPDDEGERAYLLALSPSGGAALSPEVRDRFLHGNLTSVELRLRFQDGCSSPNGHLTVREITPSSWNAPSVNWSTTDLGGGPVNTQGVVLASADISLGAASSDPRINCDRAVLPLAPAPALRLLTGESGGLAIHWEGEQALRLSTLEAAEALRPKLAVSLKTGAPRIDAIDLGAPGRLVLAPEETLTVRVRASDGHALPDDAVTVELRRHGVADSLDRLQVERAGETYIASKLFPADGAGTYNLTVVVEDVDGWTTSVGPPQAPPQVLVDDEPPGIVAPGFGGLGPGGTVQLDQGSNATVRFNVSDLGCDHGLDPCATWTLSWREGLLGNGTVAPENTTTGSVDLTRPGLGVLTLAVTDLAGRTNTTNWTLQVRDTHVPEPVPLEGTLLSPGQLTALEEGMGLPVAFNLGDDLPVSARLVLRGPAGETVHALPEPGPDGVVRTTLFDIPAGEHTVTLVIDDGVNRFTGAWGRVVVSPEGQPLVQIPLPGAYIRPGTPLVAHLRDASLDLEQTQVNVRVNGVQVLPTINVSEVPGGADLRIVVDQVGHEDTLSLRIVARDDVGLEGSGAATVRIDARAPVLEAPDNGTWVAPGQAITFRARDGASGSSVLTVRGPLGQRVGASPLAVDVAPLLSGSGTRLAPIEVVLEDAVGNRAVRPVTVGIDEEGPSLEALFDARGLVLVVRDNGSGVSTVSADVTLDGQALGKLPALGETQDRYRVDLGTLRRGQVVSLHAVATDRVGHATHLGTADEPERLLVPDRPPVLTLERRSAPVGRQGTLAWDASDPDGDALNVSLEVKQGTRVVRAPESVEPVGAHTIDPSEPGIYTAIVTAESAGKGARAELTFYLGPEGQVTTWDPLPSRIDPDRTLSFTLRFPAPPESVHVSAEDAEGVATPARVVLDGASARVTFDPLPEGDYEIKATVVHDPGAVERFSVASLRSATSLGETLGNLVLPVLAVLLVVGLGVAVVLIARRNRQET